MVNTFAILASACVVVGFLAGGVYGAIRFLLRFGAWLEAIQRNTRATQDLTERVGLLVGEITDHEGRLRALERRAPPPD